MIKRSRSTTRLVYTQIISNLTCFFSPKAKKISGEIAEYNDKIRELVNDIRNFLQKDEHTNPENILNIAQQVLNLQMPAQSEIDELKAKMAQLGMDSQSDSEDEDTLNEARDEMDQDMDIAKRLRQTNFKHIDLPPPLELIAKSAYKEDEPIKTGAPIAFISLA